MSYPGPVRDRLGRNRCRNGLLRHGADYSKERKQFDNRPSRPINSCRRNWSG